MNWMTLAGLLAHLILKRQPILKPFPVKEIFTRIKSAIFPGWPYVRVLNMRVLLPPHHVHMSSTHKCRCVWSSPQRWQFRHSSQYPDKHLLEKLHSLSDQSLSRALPRAVSLFSPVCVCVCGKDTAVAAGSVHAFAQGTALVKRVGGTETLSHLMTRRR